MGVSHECDFPVEMQRKPRIIEPLIPPGLDSETIDRLVTKFTKRGQSLYRIRMDELRKGDPDLVITQELCDVCAVGVDDVKAAVKQLGKPVSVIALNPHSLQDVKQDVLKVGSALGREDEALNVVEELERKKEKIRTLTSTVRRRRVFCAEWLNPLMNAGHWVPEMVTCAGGVDGLAREGEPSTYVEWESVVDFDPEVIVLMPCGFTTRRTIAEARKTPRLTELRDVAAVREGQVYATDGHNYFSRSGPRLFDGIGILARMFHPELFTGYLNPELGVRMEGLTVEI